MPVASCGLQLSDDRIKAQVWWHYAVGLVKDWYTVPMKVTVSLLVRGLYE